MSKARLLRILLVGLLLTQVGGIPTAFGHALQPGYLELRQLDNDFFGVIWKKPAVAGGAPMAITARLPEQCEPRVGGTVEWNGAAFFSRWTATCAGGIEGGTVRIDGLERTDTDVLVRIEFADGVASTHRLTPTETAFDIPTQPDGFEVVRTYFIYGLEHILLGIDHLLFVLALLLLVKGTGRIIATVTAFTVAHSLTLAGATLGWVRVPGPPVEATIALSIAFVAAEVIHSRQGRPGLTERYPWVVAFTFGLLHGFGFASALAEVGLPQASIPVALLFFNVGVEAGQLLFIAAVFIIFAGAGRIAGRIELSWPDWVPALPAYAIGTMAAFWFIQRTAAFQY
ncbi:MAG: HupE/UreJ family protein [Gammaproteobacteria bacterium]|jgi:hydrogenase/urease accessory protein HupE